ncbi:MAG: hypothetical protein ACRDTT_04505 [Pseudonocardiaceae bacterium]
MPDVRAAKAREAHRLAGEADAIAARHRDARNRVIRALRADDPVYWTYPRLAAAVRCTESTIAAIVKGRLPRSPIRPGG